MPARVIHPWPLRLTHWLNAIAMTVMIGSGWHIYNASPLFGFYFPIALGGWLAGAIAWHLAAMWLLVFNAFFYLTWSIVSGHYKKLLPIRPREVWQDLRAALSFHLPHEKGIYNAVQKLLYVGVFCAGIVAVLSGLAIWKPVQLWFLCNLCGGYFAARYVHFFAMTGICLFILIHLLLVLLVPKTLPPMITGGRVP